MRPNTLTILSGALLLVALVLLALGIGHLASANREVKLQATAAVVATGRARGARATALVPTFDPDDLDLALVHEAVTAQVNQARAERGLEPLIWDETLQEAAEGQAVRLSSRRSLGHRQGRGGLGIRDKLSARWVDDALAEQLGEPAIVPDPAPPSLLGR